MHYTQSNKKKRIGDVDYVSKDMVVKGLLAPNNDNIVLVYCVWSMMQHIFQETNKD